jgi:hypothetical protein
VRSNKDQLLRLQRRMARMQTLPRLRNLRDGLQAEPNLRTVLEQVRYKITISGCWTLWVLYPRPNDGHGGLTLAAELWEGCDGRNILWNRQCVFIFVRRVFVYTKRYTVIAKSFDLLQYIRPEVDNRKSPRMEFASVEEDPFAAYEERVLVPGYLTCIRSAQQRLRVSASPDLAPDACQVCQ